MKLAGTPRLVAGRRSVYIREGGARGLTLDRVRLLAVDLASGTESVVDGQGVLRSGVRQPAAAVIDRLGQDRSQSAAGLGAGPIYADSAEVLDIQLAAADVSGDMLMVESSDGGSGTGGFTVEAEATDGQWRALGVVHPRRGGSTRAFALAGERHLRLTFREACALRFVGRLSSLGAPLSTAAELVSASDGFNDWMPSVASTDSLNALVAPGDTLRLSFQDVAPSGGLERDWYLALDGVPVSLEFAAFKARPAGDSPKLPTAFALLPNTPNPFRHSTLLRFDLSVASDVRVEVFDSMGRRVWSRAAYMSAGRHAVEWDLRAGRGRTVGAGIYSYRVNAGGRALTGKIVVLP